MGKRKAANPAEPPPNSRQRPERGGVESLSSGARRGGKGAKRPGGVGPESVVRLSGARASEDAHTLQPDESALRGYLKATGLRTTAARLEVLRVLAGSRSAMTAADVLAAVDNRLRRAAGRIPTGADKVTVYRTLNALVEAGIAHKVDPGDRVFRFTLTDHARCSDHHHDHEHPHVVCDSCGTVECIEDAEVTIAARKRLSSPGSTGGSSDASADDEPLKRFRVTRQEITLRGTCERCADESPGTDH